MKNYFSKIPVLQIELLDLRSVALFRIILGSFITWNILGYRLLYVEEFYCSNGIVDLGTLENVYKGSFDLLFWVPSDLWVYTILSITLLLAVLFTLGWRTRVITPILYSLFLGILNSNPFVVHGADFFLEVGLFWAIFLPLDRVWSIRKGIVSSSPILMKLVTIAFLTQLFCIYFSNAISKDGQIWLTGKALELVTQDWIHKYFLADFISQNALLAQLFTYLIMFIEMTTAFLVVSPFKNSRCRIVASLFILMIHLGIALALDLGPFYGAGIAFAVLILPKVFWTRTFKFKEVSNFTLKQLSMPKKWVSIIYISFTIFFTLLMVQSTFKNLARFTVLEKPIKSLPGLYQAVSLRPSFSFSIHGYWKQKWMYFAHDIPREMGVFCFVIINKDGSQVNMHTNEVIKETSDISGNQWITPIPKDSFDNTMYVFTMRSRYLFKYIEDETFENWLSYEFKKWRETHQDNSVESIQLIYIKNNADNYLIDKSFTRSIIVKATQKVVK